MVIIYISIYLIQGFEAMWKKNLSIFTLIVITAGLIAVNPKITFGQGYSGLIAKDSVESDSNSSTSSNKNINTEKKSKGIFSFISPMFQKDKETKSTTTQTKEQSSDTFQGYKNYDSYDSYYKEQQQNATTQTQPVNPTQAAPTYVAPTQQTVAPTPQAPQINSSEAYVPSTTNLSAGQRDILSKINMRSPEGLPKTVMIKRKIIAAIEKLENPKMSKSDKRAYLQKEIAELETHKANLISEQKYNDKVYAEMNLPDNYVSQMKEDNAGALQLIQQALDKFNKY